MNQTAAQPKTQTRRLALRLKGAVQGVGLRPAVVRLARQFGLSGWIQNLNGAVEVELQGTPEDLERCLRIFREVMPPAVRLDSLEHAQVAVQEPEREFVVRSSEPRGDGVPALTPDRVLCDACWGEMQTPGDRRQGYALNSCADCGPRYAMTHAAPFDRTRTSLAEFPLCAACQAEYANVEDRRFHTEGIACPDCGPQVRWIAAGGQRSEQSMVDAAVEALRAGDVIALKGVGGFQLLVDATNDDAVLRLRERKQRPAKPFAVLFRDLRQLEEYASLSRTEMDELSSAAGPIVLCTAREPSPGAPPIAAGVSPLPSSPWASRVRPWIGALLPTSGLHRLLAIRFGKPLVCTSANLSSEPLCVDVEELGLKLPGAFDGALDHTRRIVRRLDDSVLRVSADGLSQVVRRGRGLVPCPMLIHEPGAAPGGRAPVVLALGAQLKSSVCWLEGQQAELSEHIGDLSSVAALRAFEATLEELLARRGLPDAIACDMHPDYASTRVAEALAERLDRPLVQIGHHRAHVAAVAAEQAALGECLAFAWDGLGLGEDGALWGGEAFRFRADQGLGDAPRVATLRPFALLGGERALREPRRVAKSLLLQAQLSHAPLDAEFSDTERRVLEALQLTTPKDCSSVGRLFDAVASLLGVCQRNAYEAHAASWLELCARSAATPIRLELPWSEDAGFWTLEWEPLVRDLCEALQRGAEVNRLALGFHHALARALADLADFFHADTLLLGGGCFQNSLLVELTRARAAALGITCLVPCRVPAGDGGLAFGQATLARARLDERASGSKEIRSCA
ncbi:MAG: carbamoyltransferase HypF [Polyangiaceae bacterium]